MSLKIFHHIAIIWYTFRYQVRIGLLEAIAMQESTGRNLGVHPDGVSAGMFGVTPIVLQEWNNFHPDDQITDRIAFRNNVRIAAWYIGKRIPQMIKHYDKKNTLENRMLAYNAGISYVSNEKLMPMSTSGYIERIKKDVKQYQWIYISIFTAFLPLGVLIWKLFDMLSRKKKR